MTQSQFPSDYAEQLSALAGLKMLVVDETEPLAEDQLKWALLGTLLDITISFASNAENITASGNVTLTDANGAIQYINPNGSDRDVSLPALASTNHPFWIYNKGASNVLIIKTSGGTELRRLNPGRAAMCVSDGTNAWSMVPNLTLPSSSTDNTIPRFDGTDGTKLQSSGVTLDDSDNLTIPITSKLVGGDYYTTLQTIADDGVYSFTPASARGFIFITGISTDNAMYGMAYYNVTTPFTAAGSPVGASFSVTTGALTGTTGTDNRLTVSCHTDGKVYVENRRGASRNVYITLIG